VASSASVDVPGRRLAFVCSPYHRGGIERWMVDFASEWRRQHGDSWFVVPRPRVPFVNGVGRPTVSDMLDTLPIDDRPQIARVPVGDRFEFGTEAYRASVYAAAAVGAVPAGVPIIVSDDRAAWRAAAWLSGRNPFVAVVHGDWSGYDPLVQHFGEWAAAFVGVSNRVTQRIGTLMPHRAIPRVTIACGIRMPPRRRPASRDEIVRLVWLGRMREEKRISDLPKIALRLSERGVPWSLDIMGDGEERSQLVNDVARLGLAADVRFHPWGTPREVAALLATSDVLLLPSNREGMPITVMEALSHGCAVVASRVSGVEDYENHALASGCYWVHQVGDIGEAAAQVEAAHALDPQVRSERARNLAEAEFSVARTTERYASLLSRLPATHSMPRNVFEGGGRLTRFMAAAVASERVARLWLSGRYRRPAPVAVPRHEAEAQLA
jgi:glycosyltransferase involved in cell wall biosynthesis